MNPYRALVVLGMSLAACSGGDGTHAARPARDPAPVDAGRMDGDAPSSLDAGATSANAPDAQSQPPPTGPRPTRLVIEFTTVTLNGRYAPHNVGAAWVADAQSKWVHTFEVWAGPFYSVLDAYFAAGGPAYQPLLFGMKPPPDVVTSATLRQFGTHAVEPWNLLDANGNEVPDGDYSLVIEIAEQATEIVYTYPFVNAGKAARWIAPDTGNMKDVSIGLE